MRSRGSRFTLGVWWVRVCSLDVAKPFATVRNRPQPFVWWPYGCAYGKFCRRGHFWMFQTSRCFVSRGKCGTSWHSDVFCNVSKIVLCGRRNTFATFSQDELQFAWQAHHFGRVHRRFAWQAQHFRRVVLRVFLQIALAGLHQVATRCKFRGRRGILWDVMKIDGTLARNIDFEVANFQVLRKTRRKTSILKLQSVKIGGSLARTARFDAPTCLVSSLWFSCGLAVSMGEAAKPLLVEGFQAGCHVVLRGRRGTLWHPNLFDNVSKVILCGRRNTFLSFSTRWVAFFRVYTLDSTLYTSHSTLDIQHFTRYTPHFTLHTPHSTLCPPHPTLYTPHSTPYTPHSTLYTLQFTLHTPHSTLCTRHFTLHTPLSTLHTLHFPLYTPHCTLCTPHFTLHTVHSILYTLHFTLHTPHFTLYTPHFTLYTPHSTLYTPHSTLYTPHPHFTL